MKLLTFFKGRLVGQDNQGNRYFEEKFLFTRSSRPPRRWVMYHGLPEPSKIPARFHGWLHYTYESPLKRETTYGWEKKHLPNLSGTDKAYVPTGSLRATQVPKERKTYKPWTPIQ